MVDDLRGKVRARIGADLVVQSCLGYVDTAITHWLLMPSETQDSITPARTAQFAVGALTGGRGALSGLAQPG